MKKMFVVLVLLSMIFVSGCEGLQQSCRGLESKTIGVKRTVTLYSCDGTVIRKWDSERMNIANTGNSYRFIHDGKLYQISGTVLIEEE